MLASILHQLQSIDSEAPAINEENNLPGTALYSIFDGLGRVRVDQTTKLPHRIIVRGSLLAKPTEAELAAAFRIRQALNQDAYGATFLGDKAGLR